jgi:hypothetical protein
MTEKWKFRIVFIILSAYLCLFAVQKINLTASDLGRHIKNGDIVLHASEYGTTLWPILQTNFYSYTNQSFAFINHHWGFGVLAYLVYSVSGWNGLSIAFILLTLATLYFSFRLTYDESPWWIHIPLTLFLIPLIAERTEIRPEAISYFCIILFIYILSRYTNKSLSEKYLWLIPVITLFWVNLHIYFIFGFFILGAFGFEALLRKQWVSFKTLCIISVASIVAACINPFGPYLLYYPFTIFSNYGYLVAENQSISFLQNLHFINPNFLWWDITLALLILSTLWAVIKDRSRFPIALVIIVATFGYLSFSAIRNLTLFGFVALPCLSVLFSIIFSTYKNTPMNKSLDKHMHTMRYGWAITFSIAIVVLSCIHFSTRLPENNPGWGIGLLPNNMASADFVKKTNIQGPFFTNYDIGSYFIFAMYTPKNHEQVFVDNRPEAYPANFFNNEYIPMQQGDALWKQEEAKWNFNAIWFYRLDMTPWAQSFLISKINDPEWTAIFVDDYTIIFVKNISTNTEIIKKYALPKSMFGVR